MLKFAARELVTVLQYTLKPKKKKITKLIRYFIGYTWEKSDIYKILREKCDKSYVRGKKVIYRHLVQKTLEKYQREHKINFLLRIIYWILTINNNIIIKRAKFKKNVNNYKKKLNVRKAIVMWKIKLIRSTGTWSPLLKLLI